MPWRHSDRDRLCIAVAPKPRRYARLSQRAQDEAFQARSFSSAPADRQLLLLVFSARPILDRSAAVQFAASARQSAAREGSTHRKPLMTCPPRVPRDGVGPNVASHRGKERLRNERHRLSDSMHLADDWGFMADGRRAKGEKALEPLTP